MSREPPEIRPVVVIVEEPLLIFPKPEVIEPELFEFQGKWINVGTNEESCWMLSNDEQSVLLVDSNKLPSWKPESGWEGDYLISESNSVKDECLTKFDTAERYEHQARELASLAEELPVANERLTAFANYYELTGLPNLRLRKDRLKVAIATARHSDAEVAFIHVDFLNFKTINTKVGRPGGDAILREIASRLQKCVHDIDTAS